MRIKYKWVGFAIQLLALITLMGAGCGGGGDGGGGVGSWSAISSARAPGPRCNPSAVWTGSEMLVWGGYDGSTYLKTGGRYNPSANSWTNIPTAFSASGRAKHCAVWTGGEMIVWGGYDGTNYLAEGGRYDPSSNSWIRMIKETTPRSHSGGWGDPGFRHCLVCHYPLKSQDCSTCHKDLEGHLEAPAPPDTPYHRAAAQHDCLVCHRRGGPVPIPHPGSDANCRVCHH